MEKVQKIIEEKVVPLLSKHNGGIELIDITTDGYVKVRLTGACSTCPGAQQTMSEVIETAIKEECPEIKGVVPVFQVSNELIDTALQFIRRNKH